MIQQQYKNNVQDLNGDIQTTGFSIEVNESMFQMLTSNVYNDPTLAVMREWSTNACDACIAAGKDVNFDVHLPTIEEPQFFVRDYGTGLAPEDIVGLFSNLGASTKRNSNAYNGTLGIGRMAGLAVADAFTVESYYNGTRYSYAISMQNGVPVTMHLGDEPTSKANGLKLAVAVDYDDIMAYVERAEKLYKYFDYKPSLNRSDVNIHLDVSEHISDNWFITKPTGGYRTSNFVVMSQVAYEIPYNTKVDDQGFNNLVIKAEPGSVTFNPGRESLSLNKATIDYLNDAFLRIKDDYIQAANNTLAMCENDYELMTAYGSLTRAAPHQVAQVIDPTPFASTEFKNLFGNRSSYYHSSSVTNSFNYLYAGTAFDAATAGMLSLAYKNSYYKNSKPFNSNNSQGWREFFYAKHVIIDLKSKFRSALNEHFKGENLMTWQRTGKTDMDEAVTQAKNYLEAMGIPYTLASSIVEESTFTGDLKTIAPREGFYASTVENESVFKSEKMDEYDVENTTYLYLKLKNTTPIIEDTTLSFEEYQEAYNMLALVTPMPQVKGVAKKYQDFVEQLDNWLDYETYIKDKMKETTFKVPFETRVPNLTSRVINKDTYTLYPKAIQEYYLEIRDYHAFNADSSFLYTEASRSLARQMGANFITYEPQRDVDLEYLELTFTKSLPMITGTSGSYFDPSPDLVAHIAELEEFYAVHSS
jgi:hypothetical protein